MVDTVWSDPSVAYPTGLDRAAAQNLPAALWDQMISDINRLGGVDGDTKTGVQNLPNQPAFLAYNAATVTNQTGNGATVNPVPVATEVYDQAANFASSTYTVPAGAGGPHHFDAQVTITDTTVAMTAFQLNLVTSNATYQAAPNINVESAGDAQVLRLSVDCDMDAGDTAKLTLLISGGVGDTADIFGAATRVTFFSGHKVA